MKGIKILFYIVGFFILICLLAIGGLVILMNPNKLKPTLIKETMNLTGYKLDISGSLSWSFYPLLAIKAEEMTLTAPSADKPFIALQEVKIASAWSQLWPGKRKWNGDILIAKMKANGLQAENVSLPVQWDNNQVLLIDSLSASFYGGTITGKITGWDFFSTPRWLFNLNLNDVELKPLIQDMSSAKNKINLAGKGKIGLQLETTGKDREEFLKNLHGTTEFALTNGALEGVDLNYLIQMANAFVNKESAAKAVNTRQTTFTHLTGSMVIDQGVAATKNTLLLSPTFTAKAEGTIGFVSRLLNLHIVVAPQQEADATKKIKWKIPVIVTGDWQQPEIRLDTAIIEKILADQELAKLKDKAVNQIKKHIPGKTGEFLQQLLGK